MQTTHSSIVSAALVVKAAHNAVMSLIWLHSRLQSRFVRNGHNKKREYADNSHQLCQRGVGGQGRCQRQNVADSVVLETTKLLRK
jgi:hypothetical protein